MRLVLKVLLGLGIPLAAAPLYGQNGNPCPAFATLNRCFADYLDAQSPGAVAELTAKATTGPQVTLPEAETAIRDFLPRVVGALIAPGLEEDREALSFRFNQALGPLTGQFGVELHKPSLHGPLADTLGDGAGAIEKGLEDVDDIGFTVALNLESRTIGRRFGPHRNELSAALRELLPTPDVPTEAAFDAIENLLPLMQNAILPEQRANETCRASNEANRPLSCFRPTFADSLRYVLQRGGVALRALRAQRRAALENLGIAGFAQLLGNQPQLNFTFGHRMRADVVGPDEWMGAVRFEWGFRDLNWLRRRCGGGGLTADCITEHLNSRQTREAISRAERLVAELEVTHRPEHDINLATPALSLLEEASTEVQGSVTYGRYFGDVASGTRRPRMDASVSFEYQLAGDGRNDRLLGQVSYTHPVSETLAGVFGLALANKPEFLSEDARQLLATLGFTYKLVGDGGN